jgi:hypothetical protein
MKRLGLKHVYHDAVLRRVCFEGRRVVFEASLDGHWNHHCPQDAQLAFETVQNLDIITRQFNAPDGDSSVEVTDEIIAVTKLDKTRYLVDLQGHGGIEIDCRGHSEI